MIKTNIKNARTSIEKTRFQIRVVACRKRKIIILRRLKDYNHIEHLRQCCNDT